MYQNIIAILIQKVIPLQLILYLSNIKDNKLKKVFDKCKVIDALKQHNLCTSYIHECQNLITMDISEK